jgi:hypothetical protein
MAVVTEIPLDPEFLDRVGSTPEAPRSDSQLADAIEHAMRQLTPLERAVFEARVEHTTYRDIAQQEGISVTHAHRLAAQALGKLEDLLAAEHAIRARFEIADGKLRSWEAAAAYAAAELEANSDFSEPYGRVSDALERLDTLSSEMGNRWIHDDPFYETEDHWLFAEAGAIAYAMGQTSMRDILATLIDKQRAYGTRNILDYGLVGLAVRINDKVARLKNLLATGYQPERSEAIEDTWLDIVGYSVVGILLLRDQFELPLTDEEVAA